MELDLFAFLDGASPWWWVALALALGVVEVLTFTYFMLWLALAALSVAIALMIVPDMAGTSQLLTFAFLAIAYTAIGWALVRRRQPTDGDPSLNRRSAANIGRQAVVTDAFSAGVGWIEVDGVRWRAQLAGGAEAPEPGATMSITGVEGMTLIVEVVEE